ncbi:MAG: hypothetical protein JSV03_13770, partial [Planctomycetota bacterium]
MISTLRIHYAIVVFALLLTATPAVHAVVSTIDATVTAEIEEYDGIEMVNFDSAFEDLDNTTGNLPLMVEVEFMQAGTAEDVAGVSAITTFNDPRLSQIPDPNEFGIDVTAFSESSTLWYTGLSNSTETRTITFTQPEIGEPVGTELLVRSQFFV